ncbi:MAG: ADP-ribose pyrophosphatase, partial [Anaerolinea sp.]|nr:ADP-ribose pyrophosphatase [Anaerolinea sp.]
ESPSTAVVREIQEEAGFETRAVKLLAVYDRNKQGHLPHHPFSAYKLFFRCEITGRRSRRKHRNQRGGFLPGGRNP